MKLFTKLIKALKLLIVVAGFFAVVVGKPDEAKAQYPSASFTSNVFTGCSPLSVSFVNMSTQANSYLWNFGNGNTSSLADPTTVYLTSGFYTVTLIAINTLTGNRDTLVATNYINVVTNPVADFIANPTIACFGNNSIAFINLSTNATNYIWDFGDGNFSTQPNPVHTYSSTGVFTVKLIARNSFNCNNIKIKPNYITIVPNPPAAFTVNQQSSCNVNQVFNFNCTTPGASSWQWTFGDGNTSNIQNPTHVYGASGTYDVSLVVTNANGCTDTLVRPGYINIGLNLVPTFTVNSSVGCPPFNSIFNCNVPNATSWLWDFGDGTTANTQSPSHLYSNPGSYDITLTVTTSSGCNGSVTLPGYITVDQIPTPSFTVSNPIGCKPLSTIFTNTSTNGVTYLWDFGDGNTSTGFNPANQYLNAGTYNVTLTATSLNGCNSSITQNAAVVVNSITGTLSGAPRFGCSPLSVLFNSSATPAAASYAWNFGNGNTATTQSASSVYTPLGNYTVTLILTSADGCKDTLVRTNYIRVFDDTTLYTVPDTILVCTPPGTVSFTDPTLGSSSWLWNFGDGATSTVKNPTYSYTTPGIYTVTLTANMNGGCSQVINPYAIINVIPFIYSPITSVIVSPCGPYTVNFNNGTLNVASYLWDFGDGTTSTLQNPVHTFANPGTYTISLLLISINGCQTSLSTTITVGHLNPITVSDDMVCQGDAINFGLSPLNAFTSALWNFGDGNTSAVMQPTHTYTTSGTFNVSVTLTDTSGCVNSFNYGPIEVSNPIPLFAVNQPTSGCIPFLVQFSNNSTGATTYNWDFGDGNTSTGNNPANTYTVAGTYSVTLTASAPGCTRSTTLSNLITANQALANFSFTPSSGCLPLTVTFTDLSTNAVSWSWDFGDGNTSSLQNPVHIYSSAPTASIALAIVDINGCTKTRYKTNIVPTIPDITASDSMGCKPLNVNFSTTLAAISYLWNFGDGSTSTLQNPSHLYTQAGLYTVTLSCVMASGCTATNVQPDFINVGSPVSAFMSPTVAVCAPTLVSFINQSTSATSYLWDFGDGTYSTQQDPSHIYNIPGTYTVTLISTSGAGCSDTLIKVDYISVPGTFSDFSLTSQTNCLQTFAQFIDQSINATSWFWNFGDGFTSTLQNPSHVYADTGSYTVTLITTDSVGCSSFYPGPNPVVVYPNPVASASVSSNSGCAPFTTSFTSNSNGAVNYMWHFGNGDSSSSVNPVYTYTVPGTYQPSLVAITAFGCTDTFNLPGIITVYTTPVAAFLPDVTSGCEPLVVTFTNQSAPLSNPTYSWDFGNGQTSIVANPVITFNNAGVYPVQLIVSNAGGCVDTVIQNITVLATPVAIAAASTYSGCSPLPVSFINSSTGASSYLWDFGDGSTSSATNPTHTLLWVETTR
ncbi:MAG: PKD domain-containing protein [Bacteroidetes bacterium]|nr:PKD domain-containing protein [Bacteroidota bacterium]